VKLSRKLFASYVVLVAASTVTLVVAADHSLRSRLLNEATIEVTRETAFLADAVAGRHGAALDALVYRLGRETGRRLTVIDTTGLVIADSDFPHDQLATLENHATRPEFRAALHGATGTDLRHSVSTGRWEIKVAMPIPGGAARVSTPLPQVDAVVGDAQNAVLLGGLLALAVGAVLAFGFARSVARPLLRLRDAAQAFAHGNASTIDARGRDEVGEREVGTPVAPRQLLADGESRNRSAPRSGVARRVLPRARWRQLSRLRGDGWEEDRCWSAGSETRTARTGRFGGAEAVGCGGNAIRD
jgi:two-component system phosphate regulon sensor histidine kinase PhoR